MRKILAIALLAAAAWAQGPARTTVSDTIYDPAGGVANGTITISAPYTFTSADGYAIYQGGVAVATITNGTFTVQLVPNAGSAPASSYTVLIRTEVSSWSETWIVPSSASPVRRSAVIASVLPTPNLMISASQLTAPSNCISLGGFFEDTAAGWTCSTSPGGMANPMTTSGDIIVAGANGLPNRLATGTVSQFLAGGTTWRSIQASDLPGSITSNTSGKAATADALAAAPTQCAAGQYSSGIAASGNANCGQVGFGQLSGVPSLVNSFAGRSGAVTPAANDYTAAQVTNAFDRTAAATLTAVAAPATPAVGFAAFWFDSANLLPEAKNASGSTFIMPAPIAATSHEWLQALGPNGAWTQSQPTFGDLSGSLGDPQLPADAAKFTGTITAGHCTDWSSPGVLGDAGAACGTGGSGMVYPGAGVANSTGSAWGTSYGVGTAANDLVQLDSSAQLPALSAAHLTNFPVLNQSTTGNAATATALKTAPTTCPGAQIAIGVDASGNAICEDPVVSYNNPAESTAAWTSATAANTAATVTLPQGSGADSTVIVSLNQGSTLTAGAVTFEWSDTTSFTNAFPAYCTAIGGGFNYENSYSLAASTNQGFACEVGGYQAFRVRLSTAISGTATVNVGVQMSAAPRTPAVAIAGTPSVAQSGTWNVGVTSLPALAAGSATIGNVNVNGTVPVSGTFWQPTQPVSLAFLPSLAAGTADVGKFDAGNGFPAVPPCAAAAPTLSVINQAATAGVLITGVPGKKIYICGLQILGPGTATSIALVEGTGANCGTGTAGMSGGSTAATGQSIAANSGYVEPSSTLGYAATATAGDSVCLLESAANQISGNIQYVVQ